MHATQVEMRQIGYWDKGKILYRIFFLSNQKEKYYSNRDQEKVKLHKGANFLSPEIFKLVVVLTIFHFCGFSWIIIIKKRFWLIQ